MTIIDGKLSNGALGTQYYKEGTREAIIAETMRLTIAASNTEKLVAMENLTAFCLSLEQIVPRINGQPIPIEIGNVFFVEGGIQSEASGFDLYYKNFTMKKGKPLEVKAFSHTSTEKLDARNKGLDLMKKDEQDLLRISKAYINRYNPYVRLLALLTGSSLTTKVPTLATKGSDDDITRAFGWVRGEDVSDFLPATMGYTHANHFRAKKGAVVDKTDITDLIDSIEAFDSYSGDGVVILAHPRTIEDLGAIYKYSDNQDRVYIDGIISPNFLGATWIACTQFHKDFLVFVDGGKRGSLIKRCVNRDEMQRGMKLIQENHIEGFQVDTGIDGLKAYIFEEEFIIAERWSGGILDIGRQGDANGYMKDESITELETYAGLVESMYKR